jgi:hypothetical protein
LYGIVPFVGAVYSRYQWRLFRKRFVDLTLTPLLDYRRFRLMDDEGGVFRFTGEIESITDGRILWVKGNDLTMPVSLEKIKCFLLPKNEGGEIPEAPEQIRWNRVSTLTEGVKVFIGGRIKKQNNRLNFISTKENPLIVIFYNCPETELPGEIIRCARTHNDYWNSFTPASLVIGALALVYVAAAFLNRPAFRLTVISALIAAFVPILPIIPPGLLFTVLHRRMTWYSRKFRAYWDLARLPLRYLQPGEETADLSTGEKYGFVKLNSIPSDKGEIPFLIPEGFMEKRKRELYFFGIIDPENIPARSKDMFVSYGILPANPALLTRRYAIKAYVMDVFAWIILFMGIFLNIIFIFLILSLLGAI